ncbi:MAG: hypothetical protein H6567_11280 [Lewinellaceae bacterium]|nr:hypothetical protein [Lewinellaceae bacterium]
MHENDQRFKENWDKIREKGRIRYGLENGAFFGFAVFVIVNIWSLTKHSFNEVFLSPAAFTQLLTMLIAGIIGYATIKWWLNERIYKKIQDKYK